MTEPHELSPLDLRDQLLELADHYDTVLTLDLSTTPDPIRGKPGSRLPPGMQHRLDLDEITNAIHTIDEWAAFLARTLADDLDIAAPTPTTTARLRLTAQHAQHFTTITNDDHGLIALAVQDDTHEHLKTMRRLATRDTRRVRTGHRCHNGCGGQYVSPLGASNNRHEDSLRCEKCGHEVPYTVWSRWPRARVQYVTLEHAARIAGTTTAAIKMRASRHKWRRIGTGRDVRYHVDDIRRQST